MAKIVQINKEDSYLWRQNAPCLVSEGGELVRKLTAQDSQFVQSARLQAAHKFNPQDAEPLTIEIRRSDTGEVVAARAERLGNVNRPDVSVTVDGARVLSTRDFLKLRWFERYGECQVRRGKFILATLRDPKVKRPTIEDAARTAPAPSLCDCRTWGDEHPGRHHHVCPHNRLAPPDEQAIAVANERIDVSGVPPPASVEVGTRVQPPEPATNEPAPVAPEECECISWRRAAYMEPDEHHPTCPHAETWKGSHKPSMVLVDLRTTERVRDATAGEVAQAEAEARRLGLATGALFLMLDGRMYGLVPKAVARPADAAEVIGAPA